MSMMHAANSADVTNQPILPLNCSIWWGMDDDCLLAVNKIQLEYANKVSQAAADAYQQIAALMAKPTVGWNK